MSDAERTSKSGGPDRTPEGAGNYEVDELARKHGISNDQASRLIRQIGTDREKLDAAAEKLVIPSQAGIPMCDDIASVVQTAVTAIREAARLVGKTHSGIDVAQITELRKAIDQLEDNLNEKKRTLDAEAS